MTTPAPPTRTAIGALFGAGGMIFVGGSVAVSGLLTAVPLLSAQAARYAVACLILLVLARLTGRRISRPRGREWAWLLGVTLSGLVVFNLALVHGSGHAEPAVLGVAVACVPVVLAVVGPLSEGRRPSRTVLIAAALVTLGAGVVQGLGRSDGIGLLWAVVVLVCEAGFTLFALPVLGRHGAWGVSVHSTWMAAVIFGGAGIIGEGPTALTRLRLSELLALGYLALGVTAIAFLLWYTSVGILGAARAGLLTGIAPAAAAVTGILLGKPVPGPMVWVGIALVGVGLAIGLRAGGQRRSRLGRRSPAAVIRRSSSRESTGTAPAATNVS